MTIQDAEASLPRWAYVLLAALTASIGLASSWITAKFFVLGLERLEPDAMARDLLIAAGVLMIATELLAFGVAALLPMAQLRAMRRKLLACGFLLLAFEATTIYATQVTLLQTSEAGATSIATRILNLTVSIDQRRLAAKTLRENGAKQSESSNAWTRSLGAGALRDALKVEQAIEPLANELAQLQSAVRPTLTNILGSSGMLVYSVARALLISVMGLVMFATAGALLRESLRGRRVRMLQPPMPVRVATPNGSIGAVLSTNYQYHRLQDPSYKISHLLGSTPPATPFASEKRQVEHDQPSTTACPNDDVRCNNARFSVPSLESRPTGASALRQAITTVKGWCENIPATWSRPRGAVGQRRRVFSMVAPGAAPRGAAHLGPTPVG